MAQQQQQPSLDIPSHFINNELFASLLPFAQGLRVIVKNDDVCALDIHVCLSRKDWSRLAVKFWPEQRCQSCVEQLLAAARATKELDGCSTAHELLSCRVAGNGNVAVSRYAGRSLTELLDSGDLDHYFSNSVAFEQFLRRLAADLLIDLLELEKLGLTFRDLKPDNIVYDEELKRFRLIDYGLAIPLSGTHFFTGLSPGYFPVDLTAKNPVDGRPYFASKHGMWMQTDAVSQSRAGSLDSNLLGITLLTMLSEMSGVDLQTVSYQDPEYQVTPAEAAGLSPAQLQQLRDSKARQFAADYRSYFADKQRLGSLLTSMGISESAVEFLLALLDVDPEQRPGIQEAMNLPWVEYAVLTAYDDRAAMKDMEQQIAERYAGFPAALQQAYQQHKTHQQYMTAISCDWAVTSSNQAASLQQRVQQLEQENMVLQQDNVILQQQLAAATAPMELATAQADLSTALNVGWQQYAVIQSLQAQITAQQQQYQQFAELACSRVHQLEQLLADSQLKQQQVYNVPSVAADVGDCYECSSNDVTAAGSGGKVQCSAGDNSSSSGGGSNHSSSDGKTLAPRTPVYSQDSSSSNPFGSCSDIALESSSHVVASSSSSSSHAAAVPAEHVSTAAADFHNQFAVTAGELASAGGSEGGHDNADEDVVVGVSGTDDGAAVGGGTLVVGTADDDATAVSEVEAGGVVAAAVACDSDGVSSAAGGVHRLLMAVSAWMVWLDD